LVVAYSLKILPRHSLQNDIWDCWHYFWQLAGGH
jgi:hypothetical protein